MEYSDIVSKCSLVEGNCFVITMFMFINQPFGYLNSLTCVRGLCDTLIANRPYTYICAKKLEITFGLY